MKTKPKDPAFYSTADLGIAVYLFSTSHKLTKTTLQGPKRLIFHFEQTDDIEAQVSRYLNGTGQASAKRLFENYRALRALAFAKTDNLR